jgi:hypothetical protein
MKEFLLQKLKKILIKRIINHKELHKILNETLKKTIFLNILKLQNNL